MEYKFQRNRADKIQRSEMLDELEKAALLFNYVEFGWRDFSKVAKFSGGTVKKEFNGWNNAMTALKNQLLSRNIVLKPRKKEFIPEKELFLEMDRVWSSLSHRPSRDEWENAKPKFSYGTYKRRFHGWQNACLKFIEYKMGGVVFVEETDQSSDNLTSPSDLSERRIGHSDVRTVALKLRLDVLSRDNFRCVFCGKSPATEMGVKLHIDHIVPFSKGGKTSFGNLQTLCYECNLGKGNRPDPNELAT